MTPQGPESSPAVSMIDGRLDFQAALRRAFAALAEADCREVFLCDRHYADWPLSEVSTLNALSRWAFAHRRLVVLAAEFDTLARRHPRWLIWRRDWSHVVSCRQVDEADADSIGCFFLAPPRIGIQLHDVQHWRGSIATRPADVVQMRNDLADPLQRSQEAFPVTTLGL